MDQEGTQAVVRDLEMGLALSQVDIARAAPDVGFDNAVRVQSHDRAVRQGHGTVLADGSGQHLSLTPLGPPDDTRDGRNHYRRGREPYRHGMAPGMLLATAGASIRSGSGSFELELSVEAVESLPDLGKLVHGAPMARILA